MAEDYDKIDPSALSPLQWVVMRSNGHSQATRREWHRTEVSRVRSSVVGALAAFSASPAAKLPESGWAVVEV